MRISTGPEESFGSTQMYRLYSPWGRYGGAVVLTFVASLVYLLAGPPDVNSDLRYFGFALAVVISAILGGLGPGLLATGLAGLISAYLLLPPIYSIQIASVERTSELILFLGEGLLLSFAGNMIRDADTADVTASGLRRYLSPVLFVAVATGLKLIALRGLEHELPFALFYATTAASAWAG